MFCCCYGVGTWAVVAAVRSCPLHCALGHRDAWLMARNQCAGHPQPQTEHLVLDLGDGIPALAPFPFWGRTNTKPKHCVLGMPGLAESGLSSYADSFHLAGAAVLSQWGFFALVTQSPHAGVMVRLCSSLVLLRCEPTLPGKVDVKNEYFSMRLSSLNNEFWEVPWQMFCRKSEQMTTTIPSGFMLCEAIVCSVLQGCLAWPSMSSSLCSLNRLCWRNDWNRPVPHLLLAFMCLFVCLFLKDYFKDLEVSAASEAGSAHVAPGCSPR